MPKKTENENIAVEEEIMESTELETINESEVVAAVEAKKEQLPVVESTITEEDAAKFEKEATIADAFIRRSLTVPGKKARRNAFKEDEVIFGDEGGEIETFSSMKKREYELLSDSAKSEKPKVLYGRIIGSEEVMVGNTKTVNAICNLITDKRSDINTDREIRSGIYKIIIPAPMLFINRKEHLGEDGYESLKKQVEMRVDSIVEFVVYDLQMDNINVLASRLRAMQILSYDNYLGKRAGIKPGMIVKSYITYINHSGIVVDAFGAEFFIPVSHLAWKYIRDPLFEKDLFRLGKAVPVRITSMEKATAEVFNFNQPYMKVTGSIKDAKENPNELFFDKYVLGQKYKAEIAFRTLNGGYIVNLGGVGDGFDGDRAICFCKPPAIELGGTPRLHQNCQVAIVQKDPKNYQLVGAITYLEA